ncbi:MAG: CDGSH iron-sulfur domain-containing protein [Bacteroidales bacterium]|nr:CDGSH iron-sulfur domain-containing protein [Bacteroidales bacterium]
MKGASTAEIIRIVDLCPTNALTYKWNKDIETAKNLRQENGLGEKPAVPVENQTSSHTPTPTVEIRVLPDGPLVVKGDFITIGSDGKELRKMKISTFCRCGRSLNMPYCDGTHRKVGFSSK